MWAKPVLLLQTPGAQALALTVVFVMVATFVVMAGRQSSQPAAAAVEVQTATAPPAQDTALPQQTTEAAPTRATNRTPAAVRPTTSESASKPAAVAPASETRAASTATASAQDPDAITITGCLERDDDRFRLKNTEGEDAPRSRSWTTGFVTRRNRSVDVVDARNRFRLADHIGERVSATGTLVDGDLELRSLRRVAASCDKEA